MLVIDKLFCLETLYLAKPYYAAKLGKVVSLVSKILTNGTKKISGVKDVKLAKNFLMKQKILET